jgi:hypothetical protein
VESEFFFALSTRFNIQGFLDGLAAPGRIEWTAYQ